MKKRRFIAKVMSCFMMLGVLMSLAIAPASAEVNDIESAKNGIVCVQNEEGTGLGTGFAIGKPGKPVQYIVTNCHVVQNSDGSVPNTATVAFSAAANNFMVANVYFSDVQKDLAVLKLPEAVDYREALVLRKMEDTDLSGTVAALGYPVSGLAPSDYNKLDISDIVVTKGGIKKTDRVEGQDVYLMDLVLEPGNSGGPIVNADGEAIGIATMKYNTQEVTGAELSSSYAIAIDELLNVIDTNVIPVTVHKSGLSPIVFAIFVAVIVLIIILIVVLLIVRKNKAASASAPIQTAPHMQTTPYAPEQPSTIQNQRNISAARIIGMGGYMTGRSFDVNGCIKIGRDASKCAVSFPVSTKGVSGVHCEVTYDGRVCYITDLNSSYGTYVNGQKLTPNAPVLLNSGAKFYLAAPENTFEIRY